jgi:hypothetical protein
MKAWLLAKKTDENGEHFERKMKENLPNRIWSLERYVHDNSLTVSFFLFVNHMTFEGLTALKMSIVVFWIVTRCILPWRWRRLVPPKEKLYLSRPSKFFQNETSNSLLITRSRSRVILLLILLILLLLLLLLLLIIIIIIIIIQFNSLFWRADSTATRANYRVSTRR